jgi:hypothetical protein
VVGKRTTAAGNEAAVIKDITSTVFEYRAPAPDAQITIEREIERMHRIYPVTNDHLPAVNDRPDKIVFKRCTKLDNLEPNTAYTIVALSSVVHRGQERYVMRLTRQVAVEGDESPEQAVPSAEGARASDATMPTGEGADVPIDGLVSSNVKFEEEYRRMGAMNRPFRMRTVTMAYDKARRGRVMGTIILA